VIYFATLSISRHAAFSDRTNDELEKICKEAVIQFTLFQLEKFNPKVE
jgi:hypothetical protein